MNSCQRAEKAQGYESYDDANRIWSSFNGHQGLEKETEGIENHKNRNHPDHPTPRLKSAIILR